MHRSAEPDFGACNGPARLALVTPGYPTLIPAPMCYVFSRGNIAASRDWQRRTWVAIRSIVAGLIDDAGFANGAQVIEPLRPRLSD